LVSAVLTVSAEAGVAAVPLQQVEVCLGDVVVLIIILRLFFQPRATRADQRAGSSGSTFIQLEGNSPFTRKI
jgi:hypothetical protein